VVKVNYQREKRRKDLDRQRKQEEKRTRKLAKDLASAVPGMAPGSTEDPTAPESQERPDSGD
jgi:hypothetical protein